MRVPRVFAWGLILAVIFTAGLLRQFNALTPASPFAPPVIGSLLFACIVFLVLVARREAAHGPAPGPGVRLGSLIPLLLMLLLEKWASISLYRPAFRALAPSGAPEDLLDAWYRAFAGAGLLTIGILATRLSPPTARRIRRLAAAAIAPRGLLVVLGAVAGACGSLWLVAVLLGRGDRLQVGLPEWSDLTAWALAGQATLAFAEELYYRGIILCEIERLAPRLGARSPAARRWVCIGTTSALFTIEHVTLEASELTGEIVFSAALGLLLALLVLATRNLWIVAGLHAWINWLVLGVAPHWQNEAGQMVPPPAAYVSIALLLAFLAALPLRRAAREAGPAPAGG